MNFLKMLSNFFMSIIDFFISIFSSLNKKENKENFDMDVVRLGGKKKRRNKK
jgi:hypothetical protein